jgi:hypothetical protein
MTVIVHGSKFTPIVIIDWEFNEWRNHKIRFGLLDPGEQIRIIDALAACSTTSGSFSSSEQMSRRAAGSVSATMTRKKVSCSRGRT